MSDWEIKSLQNQLERETKHLQFQIDRLDKKVWKDSTNTFIWLMILSNVLFLLFMGHIWLKRDFEADQLKHQHGLIVKEIQK